MRGAFSITNKYEIKTGFKKGIYDGLPICFGYFSVSFAFGVFAVAQGLSVLEAALISLTNLTSAGQLAGVPIICSCGGFMSLRCRSLSLIRDMFLCLRRCRSGWMKASPCRRDLLLLSEIPMKSLQLLCQTEQVLKAVICMVLF